MGTTTDTINILLRINGSSSYRDTMNQVTNSTNGFNNSVGKLASTLAKLVSAGAILKFSKDCIEAASNLQEVANVVDVTFGSRANVVNEWAKNQAASFGLSEKAAKEYAGTYGTMAQQFGRTGDEAVQMSIELTKLTGDVASFYNITNKDAATKLKGIFTGETESLKSLGVVMTEANLNAYALNKGLSVQYKNMDENNKAALRYSFVLDKLRFAQGDFARTSDGWANSVRKFQLQLENMKVEIGNELIPVAGYGLQILNTGLQWIAPKLIAVAQTVKYYVEAWKQASDATKSFANIAVSAVAVMLIAPKVIAMVRVAVRLLTLEVTTLAGAVNLALGLIGILFAAFAFAELTKSVKEMKNLGESAEVSAEAVDDLSDSVNNLGDSTKKLDTFLASFDEVNKVGGSSTVMSNIVNASDIANILGFSEGLDEVNGKVDGIQSSLNSMAVPDITSGTFLDVEWWGGIFELIGGFIEELGKPSELIDDFLLGLHELGDWFETNLPNWTAKWEGLGEKIYNALHPNEGKKDEGKSDTFIWKDSDSGREHVMQKYNSDGSETDLWKAYKHNTSTTVAYAAGGYPNKGSLFLAGESGAELVGNFGGSQTRVLNSSQMSGGGESSVVFSPTIQIDGRKISAVVIDNINSMTRSSGRSPLIELGG